MVRTVRWLRCEVPFLEAGDFTGRLLDELAQPYALAGAPEGIAIYESLSMHVDPVSVWLTENAAALADG